MNEWGCEIQFVVECNSENISHCGCERKHMSTMRNEKGEKVLGKGWKGNFTWRLDK